jgi:hypothetical protein
MSEDKPFTFDEFVLELREIQPLYVEYEDRRNEPDALGNLRRREDYQERFKRARSLYLRGSKKDPIEFEIRSKVLQAMFLLHDPYRFYEKEHLERSVKRAEELLKSTKKEEIAKEIADREEREQMAIQGLPPKESKKKALTISERAVNFLFCQQRLGGTIKFSTRGRELDTRLMWVVDVLSVAISNEFERYNDATKAKEKLVLFDNPSHFEFIVKNHKELDIDPFEVTLKASKVRDEWGFDSNQLSINEVVELFESMQEVIFNITRACVLSSKIPQKNRAKFPIRSWGIFLNFSVA